MSDINSFSGYTPTWCPGCGNHGIGIALKTALTQLGLGPDEVMVVFGVGCSGNMNDFLNAYAIHSLHGRSLPTAIGMKLANHKKTVIAVVGDGDTLGEGGNHFLHACRGNHDIKVIVHDNRVYGLTTGQVAPTAQKGYKSKSTPQGIIEVPVNPLALALIHGAGFIGQGFAGQLNDLVALIKAAINHKGFSLVNVLQPCVTFNKINTYQYYLKQSYKLADDYKNDDYKQALAKSIELNEEKFPLGIIYQTDKPAYHEQIGQLNQAITLIDQERFNQIDNLLTDFR
jgi:2-oxoglutarate ferredoxin oxidoreductase subunit beta